METDLIKKSNELVNKTPFNKVLQLKIFSKIILEISKIEDTKIDNFIKNKEKIKVLVWVKDLTTSMKVHWNTNYSYQEIMDTMGDLMVYKGTENWKRIMKALFISIEQQDIKSDFLFEPSEYLLENVIRLEWNYTQYFFKNIINLNSVFSIKIYELLQQIHSKNNYREYEIEELKEILGVKDKYKLYWHFKSKVLKVAEKEIKEKTDLSFYFIEYKQIRKVVKIRLVRVKNNTNKETENIILSNKFIQKLIDFWINSNEIQSLISIYWIERIEKNVLYTEIQMKKTKIDNVWWYFKKSLKNDYASQLVISDIKEEKRKKQEIENKIKENNEKKKVKKNKEKNKIIIQKYLELKKQDKEDLLERFYNKKIKGSIIYERYWDNTDINNIIENQKILPVFRSYISKKV